jgi:hypothetical protein
MDALAPAFRWLSPLGASAALFGSYTIFCAVLGVAGPLYLHSSRASLKDSLFFHAGLEARMYGAPTRALVEQTPLLLELRRQVMDVWCSFALATAIAQAAIIWFGLRPGRPWALWTLAASDLVIAASYFLLVLPAAARRTSVGLFELHPFAWYPLFMVPVATGLGWYALHRGAATPLG